jgi:hypothetical protein
MTDYEMYAGWRPRRESCEECARRLAEFLKGLQKSDEAFSHWYGVRRSLRESLKHKLDVNSLEQLCQLLRKGVNRGDYTGEVIEDLGFTIGLWNGRKDATKSILGVECGCYSERLGNSVGVEFPKELGGLADPVVTSRILAHAVRSWHGMWGAVESRAARHAALGEHFIDEKGRGRWRVRQLPGPFVDWMLYVSRATKNITSVPSPSTLMPVDDLGVIIIVQPHPPSRDNPEDMKHIRAIEEIVKYD